MGARKLLGVVAIRLARSEAEINRQSTEDLPKIHRNRLEAASILAADCEQSLRNLAQRAALHSVHQH